MKVIDRSKYPSAANVEKGAYTLWQNGEGTPDLTIIATGSEVEIALEAAQQITDRNVRVVSMPSWELFAKQNQTYRDRIIDPAASAASSSKPAAPSVGSALQASTPPW
jgi:transketolase